MAWVRARIEVPGSGVPAVEALMETLGAVAVSLEDAHDQPLLEPDPGALPLWSHVVVSALFPADPDLPERLERARAAWREAAGFALPELLLVPLRDADWKDAWRQHAQCLTFGERLRIVPSDDVAARGPFAGVSVALAPGLAFGTGSHPTTRSCLARLAHEPPVAAEVIDFGCGSGILALAALALGARRVLGVDHDPQAIAASRENARRNGRDADLELASELPLAARCDLLLANVLAGPLIELADPLRRRLRPNGRVILSGILLEQEAAVRAAWPDVAFETVVDEGWVCLDGRLCA